VRSSAVNTLVPGLFGVLIRITRVRGVIARSTDGQSIR
jgi:hypothetical protein